MQSFGGAEEQSYVENAAEVTEEVAGQALNRVRPLGNLADRFFGGKFSAAVPGSVRLPDLKLGHLPVFARGKAYGATAGQWYRISYGRTLKNAIPLVAALSQGTSYRQRGLNGLAALSALQLPYLGDLSLSKDHDYRDTAYNWVGDNLKSKLGDWGLLNGVRDLIILPCQWVGWVGGWMADKLFDLMVGSLIDRINSRLNKLTGTWNSSRNKWEGGINEAIANLHGLRADIQGRFDETTTAINGKIDDLLAAWGLPTGLALVSPQLRNISDTGFEFLSQGKMSLFWIAIADPE